MTCPATLTAWEPRRRRPGVRGHPSRFSPVYRRRRHGRRVAARRPRAGRPVPPGSSTGSSPATGCNGRSRRAGGDTGPTSKSSLPCSSPGAASWRSPIGRPRGSSGTKNSPGCRPTPRPLEHRLHTRRPHRTVRLSTGAVMCSFVWAMAAPFSQFLRVDDVGAPLARVGTPQRVAEHASREVRPRYRACVRSDPVGRPA